MAKVIVGTQGRINELLAGIKDEDIIDFYVNNDKAWVILSSTAAPMGEPQIIEKEKIVEVDNPKLLAEIETLNMDKAELNEVIEFKEDMIKDLNEDIQKTKKELEQCKNQSAKEIEKLKKAIDALGT